MLASNAQLEAIPASWGVQNRQNILRASPNVLNLVATKNVLEIITVRRSAIRNANNYGKVFEK